MINDNLMRVKVDGNDILRWVYDMITMDVNPDDVEDVSLKLSLDKFGNLSGAIEFELSCDFGSKSCAIDLEGKNSNNIAYDIGYYTADYLFDKKEQESLKMRMDMWREIINNAGKEEKEDEK